MKHIKTIGMQRPAPAQFESVIQLVGLFNSIVSLLGNIGSVFGVDFSAKGGSGQV